MCDSNVPQLLHLFFNLGGDATVFHIEAAPALLSHRVKEMATLIVTQRDNLPVHKDRYGIFSPRGTIPLSSVEEVEAFLTKGHGQLKILKTSVSSDVGGLDLPTWSQRLAMDAFLLQGQEKRGDLLTIEFGKTEPEGGPAVQFQPELRPPINTKEDTKWP